MTFDIDSGNFFQEVIAIPGWWGKEEREWRLGRRTGALLHVCTGIGQHACKGRFKEGASGVHTESSSLAALDVAQVGKPTPRRGEGAQLPPCLQEAACMLGGKSLICLEGLNLKLIYI